MQIYYFLHTQNPTVTDNAEDSVKEEDDESPLLKMFESPSRVKILHALFHAPSEQLSVSELENKTGVHRSTIYRNIDQLVGLGVVNQVQNEEPQTYYTLNYESPISAGLKTIEKATSSDTDVTSADNNYSSEVVEGATRNILGPKQETSLEEGETKSFDSEELSSFNTSPATPATPSDADLNFYRGRFTDIVIGRERSRLVLEAIARLNQDIFGKAELTDSINREIDLIAVTRIIEQLKQFGIVVGVPKIRRSNEEYLRRVPTIIKWLQNLSKSPAELPAGHIVDYLTHFQRSSVHELDPEDIDPIEAYFYSCLAKGILFNKTIPRVHVQTLEPVQDETWPDTYGYQIAVKVDTDYSIYDQTRLEASLEVGCRWIIETAFYDTDIDTTALSDALDVSVATDNDGVSITGEIEPQFKL
jgi:DNA-binding MarR family transcriptional regulator